MYELDFEKRIETYIPCELLVHDICFGAYYCGCANGYWKETLTLQKVEGRGTKREIG